MLLWLDILYIITVYGLTEERFMVLLYCLPLLCKVWQRSGSCCCCYIFYHYFLGFIRGVVHVAVVIMSTVTIYGLTEKLLMLLLLFCLPLLLAVWQRSNSCCIGWLYCLTLLFKVWQRVVYELLLYIYHYSLKFDRGVVLVLVVMFSTISVKVWQCGSCCCCYIVYH
jgi:hypothetical protein